MWIVASAAGRIGNGDIIHRIDCALPCFLRRGPMMCEDRLGNLISDAHDRVERGHWFLENHGDARSTKLAHGFVVERREASGSAAVFGEEDVSGDPSLRR